MDDGHKTTYAAVGEDGEYLAISFEAAAARFFRYERGGFMLGGQMPISSTGGLV